MLPLLNVLWYKNFLILLVDTLTTKVIYHKHLIVELHYIIFKLLLYKVFENIWCKFIIKVYLFVRFVKSIFRYSWIKYYNHIPYVQSKTVLNSIKENGICWHFTIKIMEKFNLILTRYDKLRYASVASMIRISCNCVYKIIFYLFENYHLI